MEPTPDASDHRPGAVLVTDGAQAPDWLASCERVARLRLVDSGADDAALHNVLAQHGTVLLDGRMDAPLSAGRRIRRLAPACQLLLVARDAERKALERSLLYTPGLGEVWLVAPEEITAELLREADAVGTAKRSHASRAQQVAGRVASLAPRTGQRPFLANQYLATLLELLPHPVLSLDETNGVLFANPAARALLQIDRSEGLTPEQLRTRLAPLEEASLDQLLEAGRRDTTRRELTLNAGGERRVFDASAAPVAGERPSLAVVLHDVTEQVRIRERLREQGEELQQQNEEMQAQAEELEMQAEQMEAQAADLRNAMQHRSRFYANMSHELRTPINAILGYTDLLLGNVYGSLPREQREALDRTSRAGKHLLELVNDVLDLAKIEAGRVDVQPQPTDMADLTRDLRATMEPMAEDNGASLRFTIDESCRRPFTTDPRRLKQILMNLLSNAIRYGGGEVEVRATREADRLSVEVEDRGPGIPALHLERIFEEFVQLGDTAEGGTGLGLGIARALAGLLGGDLTARSEVGSGSVFTVRLPELTP